MENLIIIEISVAIIAACFIVITIVFILFGLKINNYMKKLDDAVSIVGTKTAPIVDELTKVMDSSSQIVEHFKESATSIDPVCGAISKIGNLLNSVVAKFPKAAVAEEKEEEEVLVSLKRKKMALENWAEWMSLGILLFRQLKKGWKNGRET